MGILEDICKQFLSPITEDSDQSVRRKWESPQSELLPLESLYSKP